MPGLRTWEQLLFTKKTVRSPQIKDTHQRRAADFMLEDRLRESDESRRVPKMTRPDPSGLRHGRPKTCEVPRCPNNRSAKGRMSTHCEYMQKKPLVGIGVVADELKL